MSHLADKARFKEALDKLIREFGTPISRETFVGASPGRILEHVTRRHFIDPFLHALGWDLSQLNEEMIEEAQTRGETTLRLDYLGVNPQTRVPLVIIEAKAWAAPFVAPSSAKGGVRGQKSSTPISLICEAIEHCKSGGSTEDSPVIQAWAEYLFKLHQYVRTVKDESGHVVTRVATLSGQWLVIFNDPKAIFLSPGKFNSNLIGVYRDRELIDRAEEIHDQIARSAINDALPEMVRPSLVPAFMSAADVKRAYHALWISRQTTGASFKPRPNLDFEVALILERQDGALLTVIDQSLDGGQLPHRYEDLIAHIEAVDAQARELLRRVNTELRAELVPTDVESFPGFGEDQLAASGNVVPPAGGPRLDMIRMAVAVGEFLLVTGTAKHFLLPSPRIDPCAFHDWAACQRHPQGDGVRMIFGRSVNPKAFFQSGEPHHCAHQLVHDRRNRRCQIDAFEEFLCCRACSLQSFCWPNEEIIALPCGTPIP